MKVFCISDLHTWHNNILILGKGRPFETMVEMRDTIRQTWNARVSPGDIVYMLGDLCARNIPQETVRDYVDSLNGEKIFSLGNHDDWEPEEYLKVGFNDVGMVFNAGDGVMLGHYPIYNERDLLTEEFLSKKHAVRYAQLFVDYNKILRAAGGKFLIHGHVHSQESDRLGCYNVSIDLRGWGPTQFEDAKQRIYGTINWKAAASEETLAILKKEVQQRRNRSYV